jgi:hypothetical protein
MFYIIGVSHRVQSKNKGAAETSDQHKYHLSLEQAIQRRKPVVVAEEFSEYALSRARKKSGTEQEPLTKIIAESSKVEHRYCDPDKDARIRIGYREASELSWNIWLTSGSNLSYDERSLRAEAIEMAKYWPRREQFWLAQLSDVCARDVVFVCGNAHIESFRELLGKHNIDSTVEHRHIGVTSSDDKRFAETKAYIAAHPDVLAQGSEGEGLVE